MENFYLPTVNYPWTEYTIELDGASYSITTKYNAVDESWYMDLKGISNAVDFKGIKLVGGVDLLYPFAILELGQMFVLDLEGYFSDPDQEDFGDRFKVLYVPKENRIDIL